MCIRDRLHVTAFKIDDLRILTAQLDGNIGLWSQFLQGSSHGYDLLRKGNAEVVGQCQTAGTGDHRVQLQFSQLVISFLKELRQCFPDIGEVTLIIGK